MFGEKPQEYSLPVEEKDHSDLDDKPELDAVVIIINWCTSVVSNFRALTVYYVSLICLDIMLPPSS